MKGRYFLSLILHLLLPLNSGYESVNAQPQRLQFSQLTPDDGLSSSIIASIIQDYKGFMWIGTTDGLNRYDGFKFVVYKNDPADLTSISNNVVLTLFEDRNRNLLIGTENGLCLYDRLKDRFFNYTLEKTSPLKGLECSVSKIVEDQHSNLWLATSVGLIYFDRAKNSIIRFNHNPDDDNSLSDDNVVAVLIDKSGRLWATTHKGLNLYLPDSGRFRHFEKEFYGNDGLSDTVLRNLVEDRERNLWIGSRAGLYCARFDERGKLIKRSHYQHDNKDDASLSIDQVNSLYVDNSGYIWIGTESGGINLFDQKGNNFRHFRKDDYDPQSISNESIEAIYQDRTGNLWFGTYTGGVNIYVKNKDVVNNYQNLPGAPFSLSHNTVTCFLEDHLNQIWIGTDGGGMNLFNSENSRFTRFKRENTALSSNSILCLMEDSKNTIWMGTWAGGLVNFNPSSGSFTALTTKNSGIGDDNIYAIEEGSNNDLWLGSFEHGLINYNRLQNKFTVYNSENSALADNLVVKIVKLSGGRLLIGNTTCLQVFSTLDGSFKTYNSIPDNPNSLSFPRVTDILAENDSCIWVGTPYGLNRLNLKTGSIRRYFEADGLPDNFINGLAFDKSGSLWITTNHGVCRFDYKTNNFKKFTKSDGFQSNQFSERSVLQTKDGLLLMGGIKGFNIVDPQKITENKTIPEVIITELKVFNKSVRPGRPDSMLKQNISETKALTLSYKNSVLTFTFAVMDFSAPEKNQYAYKMENFDRDWTFSGNKAEVTYTNLNPGNYVLRVKGSNNDELWNETGTSLAITILPPWWLTWWFKLIVISILISGFTLFFFGRVRKLNRQRIILEETVALKTAELKEMNASKDKFFSIIAHDLKNPFSTIIGFSEMLKDGIATGDSAKTKEFAGIINTSAVRTLRLLENLLEWANSQQGNIKFNPDVISFNEILNEEFSILNDLAAEKNILLRTAFPENISILGDRNMLKTVLRNLISNAIKFTPRNGKIEVKAIVVQNNVEITVSDNGIGMSEETLAKLFRIDANLSTRGTEGERGTGLGLFLCKEFVEKHGGKIWVDSAKDKGSVFRLVLPSA